MINFKQWFTIFQYIRILFIYNMIEQSQDIKCSIKMYFIVS